MKILDNIDPEDLINVLLDAQEFYSIQTSKSHLRHTYITQSNDFCEFLINRLDSVLETDKIKIESYENNKEVVKDKVIEPIIIL